jgi:hypothetical protein
VYLFYVVVVDQEQKRAAPEGKPDVLPIRCHVPEQGPEEEPDEAADERFEDAFGGHRVMRPCSAQ